LSDWAKVKFQASVDELRHEREIVADWLKG
jgi:hypothetical protein